MRINLFNNLLQFAWAFYISLSCWLSVGWSFPARSQMMNPKGLPWPRLIILFFRFHCSSCLSLSSLSRAPITSRKHFFFSTINLGFNDGFFVLKGVWSREGFARNYVSGTLMVWSGASLMVIHMGSEQSDFLTFSWIENNPSLANFIKCPAGRYS